MMMGQDKDPAGCRKQGHKAKPRYKYSGALLLSADPDAALVAGRALAVNQQPGPPVTHPDRADPELKCRR